MDTSTAPRVVSQTFKAALDRDRFRNPSVPPRQEAKSGPKTDSSLGKRALGFPDADSCVISVRPQKVPSGSQYVSSANILVNCTSDLLGHPLWEQRARGGSGVALLLGHGSFGPTQPDRNNFAHILCDLSSVTSINLRNPDSGRFCGVVFGDESNPLTVG